jgi:hypothetical protein
MLPNTEEYPALGLMNNISGFQNFAVITVGENNFR